MSKRLLERGINLHRVRCIGISRAMHCELAILMFMIFSSIHLYTFPCPNETCPILLWPLSDNFTRKR